jgi:predicted 3-demethylubiquinone-9 3-methyltransferase (glyoxalase superfamily)
MSIRQVTPFIWLDHSAGDARDFYSAVFAGSQTVFEMPGRSPTEPGRCGWLKDRFGVSWQIIPTVLPELLGGPDPEGRARATEAMLAMDRLVKSELRAAYAGT